MQKVDRRFALALGFAGASKLVFGKFAAQAQPAKPTGWPDKTNTGHKNAPGYPGSLTPFSGTIQAGETYKFMDFADGAFLTVSNVTFIGCRFQSNSVDYVNVNVAAGLTGIKFQYCTFCPVVAKAAAPTYDVWPSAGALTTATGNTGYAPYMIGGTAGYQFAIVGLGGFRAENCDIWGFGNAVTLFGSAQKSLINCWIHDPANPDAKGYHTDGPGYLNGSTGPSNVLIKGCTIAMLGNTNCLAFQAGSNYDTIVVDGNYFSGGGYCVDMCHNGAGNRNLQFVNNVLGTDVRWHWGPLYADYTGQFQAASNVWHNNKLKVVPGTSPAPSSNGKFTAADDGKFVLPNGSYSTTDWNE